MTFFPSKDVKECNISNGGCDHVCHEAPGTFVCTCNEGFELKSDGLNCIGMHHMIILILLYNCSNTDLFINQIVVSVLITWFASIPFRQK